MKEQKPDRVELPDCDLVRLVRRYVRRRPLPKQCVVSCVEMFEALNVIEAMSHLAGRRAAQLQSDLLKAREKKA